MQLLLYVLVRCREYAVDDEHASAHRRDRPTLYRQCRGALVCDRCARRLVSACALSIPRLPVSMVTRCSTTFGGAVERRSMLLLPFCASSRSCSAAAIAAASKRRVSDENAASAPGVSGRPQCSGLPTKRQQQASQYAQCSRPAYLALARAAAVTKGSVAQKKNDVRQGDESKFVTDSSYCCHVNGHILPSWVTVVDSP